MVDLVRARERMVERQIAARGISDSLVLDAMRRIPREAFLPAELADHAYEDAPVPIGKGQTISQPYIVAYMIAALRLSGGERCLEIGTGSGYSGAVLASIASEVVSIERHAELARRARACLAELGIQNVRVIEGDGTYGHPERAPYDAIVVTAGGPSVPPALVEQLALGGRLVMPVGDTRHEQRLVRLTKVAPDRVESLDLCDVRFVPLIGGAAWPDDEDDAMA